MASSNGYRPDLLAPFHRLDQGPSIQAECMFFKKSLPPFLVQPSHLDIWIGGNNELRSKSKVRNSTSTLMIPYFKPHYLHSDDH